jgi:phosphate transport system protein
MGTRCVAMWQGAADAWAARDPDAAPSLDQVDDEMDELHEELTAEILESRMEPADIVQAALVGRFYERLGDHAVHIAQRIAYITSPAPTPST